MLTNPLRDPRLNTARGPLVERLNGGQPVIAPGECWWETGVTFNPAAIFLERSPENDPIIRELLPMRRLEDPDLAEGVVAVYYRARPERDPGSDFGRSFIGLALFTPDLRLLYRYQEPVLRPSADPGGFDALGVEDPRITCIPHSRGQRFYMVYCGVQRDPSAEWRANLCMAVSDDLLHWQKTGPLRGDIANWDNKDGVLFPERIGGMYYLLHRPFAEDWPREDFAIRLAASPYLDGVWEDLGEVMRAFHNPRMASSWIGAGSVPLALGGGRYLHIYHTGNYLNETDREYDTGAALFDFSRFDPARPSSLVTARLEPLMVPETPAELRSRSQLQVGNVLFACGSYARNGWLTLLYGGADTYTLAARVEMNRLIEALAAEGLRNPYE